MEHHILIEGINPEPWTVGTLGIARAGKKPYPTYAKNPLLVAYQQALIECLTEAYPAMLMQAEDADLELTIIYWRKLDKYKTPGGRWQSRHRADTTNLNKATEDALQKIVFNNDVQNTRVTGEIRAQGHDVEPRILIICRPKHSKFDWDSYANDMAARTRPEMPGNVYVEVLA